MQLIRIECFGIGVGLLLLTSLNSRKGEILIIAIGHSYNTKLSATIAGMFPKLVERMIIDGVVNPHEYTEGW